MPLREGSDDRYKKRKGFFFEKKEAKNFLELGTGVETGTGSRNKSFLVLFYKKEPLPNLTPAQP